MIVRLKNYIVIALALTLSSLGASAATTILVDTAAEGVPVQPTMYGIFFEDINLGADGGLYAELVKNRSFEFPQSLMGWKSLGFVEVRDEGGPFANNPHYVRLKGTNHSRKVSGLENEGFRGMGFEKEKAYEFSVWARLPEKEKAQDLLINLVDEENHIIGESNLKVDSEEWKEFTVAISSEKMCQKGRLKVTLKSEGTVDMDHISLFPNDTWKNRKKGLRRDMAQALADLKPGVFRFPGGCIVEGATLATGYDWKKTIGPAENRPLNENLWMFSIADRLTPDYYQTGGLGYYEYFLLAEDMGAEPLPIVNCGLACQFQNKDDVQPLDQLDPYVNGALDLIEFANGAVDSKWGKIRAEMGHPEPFNLKYIGVGNEQWGEGYLARYAEFSKAIQAKYPQIKIVGSAGPGQSGQKFDELWVGMRKMKAALVDEHYYSVPSWFLQNSTRYDSYPRDGVAVFAGEYACYCQSFANSANTYYSALCEAAFMTGLERNADVVHMSAYAPLFAHREGWQWRPDLIWFDSLNLVKTPNYYVQQLFSRNVGDRTVPVICDGKPLTGQNGLYASGTYDKNKKSLFVKLINTGETSQEIVLDFKGESFGKLQQKAESVQLRSQDKNAENTFQNPDTIVPVTGQVSAEGNKCSFQIGANTVGLYIFYFQERG